MDPLVSVIIPAHNEEGYIEACIRSVRGQSYKNIEIIVICDDCSDKTALIAGRHADKVLKIKARNVSAARNKGAKEAKGRILIFFDADSVMEKQLVLRSVHWIKKGFCGGTTKTRPREKLLFARFWWWLGNIFNYIYLTPSGVLFSTADAFPGYDEKQGIGEDTVVLNRLKRHGRVKYITDTCIYTSSRRFESQGYIR
ncbi:glycosyltransferase, partial [Candidatus Woesearchaeota archaeon]|nr:glycosyltransferase [Candidatus Woesearchaeota archaeon]